MIKTMEERILSLSEDQAKFALLNLIQRGDIIIIAVTGAEKMSKNCLTEEK